MFCEIHGPVGVGISDVGSKREDDWQRLLLAVLREYRCVQLDSVARRNLHAPLHVNAWLSGRRFLLCCSGNASQQNRQRHS